MIARFAILAALLSAPAALAQDCAPPADLKDGWDIATPQSQGMDAAPLCDIGARFEGWKEANAHAVLVLRHGKLVYEKYFAGEDQEWGKWSIGMIQHNAGRLHDVRSISKSVVSLLTGVAVDRGWLSVDQSVFAFFPEHADLRTPAKDRITIRHLLTMSSSLAWDESLPYSDRRNSETAMNNAADAARYVLEQPMWRSEPGDNYNYSGGSAVVLAEILRKVSGGMDITMLSKTLLFDPLGITDFEWAVWNNRPVIASGLRLRPRDLAKVGQLVLDGGKWQGRQIVSEKWIADSIAPQINGQSPFFYGYQWWLGRSLLDGRQVDWAAGFGEGGQRVFIIPEFDIVVVLNFGLYGRGLQAYVGPSILNQHVLPAVVKK
ncbi:MAG: beta-lactamase family protein [Ferrovibrio sp.]|uniref:serine hydrolase domain-containing protein n=1 Tax=Ferrovibrio sp. TaxID=1917215 RepID=UPI002609BCB4|nr:serine hydrolase [Ferrovibrio sp.]MCW0235565.1 beta-lactamase family protein [Ferrovibrio sp.]